MERSAMRWQVQEAKQRFSELVRQARDDGPQVVTKHGQEVAVVVAMEDYRRLTGRTDFKQVLVSVPDLSGLDLDRSLEPARSVELG
jgi:prevent-host-death family protein